MKQVDRTKHDSHLPGSPLPSVTSTLPGGQLLPWALVPLRLFLGITFVYAGIQKLTDPQYFNPEAPGYIGKQIMAFSHGSPLRGVLIHLALPHAAFFGLLIALGEIAIGLGTLLGCLQRPAAFFGIVLSLVFFLSASWHVFPYFYGADIVFSVCWLTMLLAGPTVSVLPVLDAFLARYLLNKSSIEQRERRAAVLNLLLGTPKDLAPGSIVSGNMKQGGHTSPGQRHGVSRGRQTAARRSPQSRRSFMWGLVTGGGAIAGCVVLWSVFRGTGGADGTTGSPASGAPVGTATTATTPRAGTAIAQTGLVPANSAAAFSLPSNGDPAVLVHLDTGQFVAYDAICTHAGCTVQYDPSSRLLLCPCHGAAFDPAKAAAVVQGPADAPLTRVPIHVDAKTGVIALNGQGE